MQGSAARLLRERRISLELTQYEVAQAAGVREYDVSRWERGVTRTLPLAGLRKVCRVLSLDLEELADALLADEEAAKRGGEAPRLAGSTPPEGSADAIADRDAHRARERSPRPARRRGPDRS